MNSLYASAVVRSWLHPAVPKCPWLLLATPGCSGMLLVAVGCRRLALTALINEFPIAFGKTVLHKCQSKNFVVSKQALWKV